MNNQCGLVNTANPCRCHKKTKGFIDAGHVDPQSLKFTSKRVDKVRSVVADTLTQIDNALDQQYAALFRDHPCLNQKIRRFGYEKCSNNVASEMPWT